MTTTPALNDDLVALLDEADDFASRMTGQPWACELVQKLADRCHAQSKEIEALRAALEPFARHIDEMKFDLDNKGDPLPDDQAVGWVYVTNGDFRRARTALKGA